jgi:2-oxoglutarate ferredoxin oxidoreductase subunit delta
MMINIDEDLCKGCHLCVFICYKNVYAVSLKPNKKGVLLPYPKFEKECTKCGDCELMCPDQAIDVDIETHWWVKEKDSKFNPNFNNKKES